MDMFFESLFVRKLYADGIRRSGTFCPIRRRAGGSSQHAIPAGADVDDIEQREKRVNLLPAVARDCLQGACRMSGDWRALR